MFMQEINKIFVFLYCSHMVPLHPVQGAAVVAVYQQMTTPAPVSPIALGQTNERLLWPPMLRRPKVTTVMLMKKRNYL